MDISKLLKNYRVYKGLTGKELGKISNTSQATISAIENGERSPTLDTLNKICNALDIDIIEFLSSENKFSKTPTSDELKLISIFNKLNDLQKKTLIDLLNSFLHER